MQAEFLQLGLSAQQAQIEVTASGQKIIDTFTNIANNASVTGDQIQLAFAKALSQATTSGEVDALKQKLQEAFDAGKIGADAFGVASAAAGRKLADIGVEAAKAGASLDGVGKSGETAAQRISNALQDTRDKLIVQANDISKAIATALSGGNTDGAAQLTAQFKSLDAEIQSLNADLNGAELKKYTDSLKALGDQADANEKAFQRAGNAAQYAGTQTEKGASQADEALKGTGETVKELSDRISDIGTGGFPDLSQALADTRAGFLGISEAAAKAFDTNLLGDFEQKFDATGIGFARVIGAMSQASADVTQKIADQRAQLQAEVDDINNIGTAGGKGFAQFGDSVDSAKAKMLALSDDIATGNYEAGLLGQQELAPLQAALQAAADRVQQLSDAFQSLAQDAQDQLDEAEGNQDAIEARRHQKELDDLKAAATAANALNTQQYQQAVANENKLHALKLKNIADQQKAQNADSGSGSNSNGASSSDASPSQPSASGGIPSGGDIHIHLDLSKATLIGSDFNKAADELTAPLAKRLASLQSRSRVNILTGK